MKGILGCCYQCDVPPETIQNLRILWYVIKESTYNTKSVVFAHGFIYLLNVQLQLEKFFCFFLGGPTQSVQAFFGWARPVGSSLQAVKKLYFYWPA